ncbi:unnamed protein product [Durusdinium trenchii]|uniref:Uncharacterized protein n=1 Tax=Durusdinium trenchii TaxID=1381693 RepID=A0ABP0I873_9DINO
MSWRQTKQRWSTNDQWAWEQPWTKKTKGKETSKPFFYGYDGKKIELEDQGGAGSSSSSQRSSEEALREENRKLKEMMKKAQESGTMGVLSAAETQQLLTVDPREDLKERQKQLNIERRTLNKTSRLKETIEEKEKKFQGWKEFMEKGLRQEEKRLAKDLQELNMHLKDAEKSEKEDAELVDDKDQEEDLQRQELEDMKEQMRDFMNYATVMEQRQRQLTEQVTMLVGALQGAKLVGDPGRDSPQHPIALTRHDEIGQKRASDGKGDRSRSPAKAAKLIHDPRMTFAAMIQKALEPLSDQCQTVILTQLEANRQEYQTQESVQKLIESVIKGEETQASLDAGIGAHVPAALLPFRKHQTSRSRDSPYSTPVDSRPKGSFSSPD